MKKLHKKMYGSVWRCAGRFRNTDKNIAVDKFQIGIQLKSLLDDTHYWLSNKTFGEDVLAIRFKHRLVSIHCFANGNGRHSRLMADILISHLSGNRVFSWSAQNLTARSQARPDYLAAMRAADANDFEPLLRFARS